MSGSGQFRWRQSLGGLALAIVVSITPNEAAALCGTGVIDGGLPCLCDCDRDCMVTVDEILRVVNIALGSLSVEACTAADIDSSGSATVDEIVTCLNVALAGCGFPCGDGDGGFKECDDGGRCVGGANAGASCIAETDCVGDGACFGGVNDLRACASDEECAGAPCRKCRPYGGDGCAANCTFETESVCNLVPGGIVGETMIEDGTSVAIVNAAVLGIIPLPLVGSQVLTAGKVVDGVAPVVVPAAGVNLDRIPVSTIACACVRGVEARTCGGTLFDRDGSQSLNCTPGFADPETCPADKACAAVHGPGNTGSGFVGCGDPGVDVEVIQDCNGTPGGQPFDPQVFVTRNEGAIPARQGSGSLVLTSAIGTVVGRCTGSDPDYGPDGQFCTDDDPVSNRGTPNSIPFTTNKASATVLNPADFEGDVLGPVETTGAPFACTDELSITVDGTDLAGAFTSCDQPTISDIAVTTNFVCQ